MSEQSAKSADRSGGGGASGNVSGGPKNASSARGGTNPYLKTKIQTATPAELRLMLLDGAIKFSELGREGLVEKNYEKSFTSISRAEDIVMELLESLRPEVEPNICAKLNDLYLYLYLQLVKASSERDVPAIENVIKLLKYERETWAMVMKKVNEENAEQAGGSAQSLQDEIVNSRPAISVRG